MRKAVKCLSATEVFSLVLRLHSLKKAFVHISVNPGFTLPVCPLDEGKEARALWHIGQWCSPCISVGACRPGQDWKKKGKMADKCPLSQRAIKKHSYLQIFGQLWWKCFLRSKSIWGGNFWIFKSINEGIVFIKSNYVLLLNCFFYSKFQSWND